MSTTATNSQIRKLLRQIQAARGHIVLHYDTSKNDLTIWHWPTNERGERVVPSDLNSHRISHRFRGPCCLCPLNPENDKEFVEAAIYMAHRGPNVGEYIAQCAEKECGYMVNLERIYSKPGVPLKYYSARDVLEERLDNGPPQEINIGEIDELAPPADRMGSVFEALLRLDSVLNPGLQIRQFKGLFAICRECRLVMTKRILLIHDCTPGRVPENEIVDLTDEV